MNSSTSRKKTKGLFLPLQKEYFSEGVPCEFVPDCFAREGEYHNIIFSLFLRLEYNVFPLGIGWYSYTTHSHTFSFLWKQREDWRCSITVLVLLRILLSCAGQKVGDLADPKGPRGRSDLIPALPLPAINPGASKRPDSPTSSVNVSASATVLYCAPYLISKVLSD